MKYLIKILLVSIFFNQTNICSGQGEKTIDYHVHVYSQELLDNLSAQGNDFSRGSFEFTCSNRECSEIDKIKSNNFAKMVLLSSPYSYKKLNDTENIDDLKAFVQRENNFLKDLVYSNRDNLYGFCGINPNWEFALEEVVRCIDTLKMDGIKFHFQANQIDFENAKTKKNILSILKYLFTKNAPVLIHLNGYDLTSGGEIAREFIQSFIETTDEQFIIFAHSGGPGGFTKFTIDVLNEFKDYFNKRPYKKKNKIYFELSGTILQRSYPGKIESKEIIRMMDFLGYDRFLFGSDYPFQSSKSYLKTLEEELQELGPELFEQLKTRNIFEGVSR